MAIKRSVTLTTLLALGVAAAVARGDTVELRAGGIIVGAVQLFGADHVVIDSVFPDCRKVTLKLDDIAPSSMRAILDRLADRAYVSRRDDADAFAASLGLLVSAIVETELTRNLDPSTATDAPRTGGHVESLVAAQRAAELAVAHFESVWALAKTLPGASSANQVFDARVVKLRCAARTKLADAYLAAGQLRNAIRQGPDGVPGRRKTDTRRDLQRAESRVRSGSPDIKVRRRRWRRDPVENSC